MELGELWACVWADCWRPRALREQTCWNCMPFSGPLVTARAVL